MSSTTPFERMWGLHIKDFPSYAGPNYDWPILACLSDPGPVIEPVSAEPNEHLDTTQDEQPKGTHHD